MIYLVFVKNDFTVIPWVWEDATSPEDAVQKTVKETKDNHGEYTVIPVPNSLESYRYQFSHEVMVRRNISDLEG